MRDEDTPSEHSEHATDTEQSDDEMFQAKNSKLEIYNTRTSSDEHHSCYIGREGETKWLKHNNIIRKVNPVPRTSLHNY